MNPLEIFSYPPLLRGLAALVAAGISFPLVGVFILRLHLVTLKFTLMHAAFLGGALALAAGIDPLLFGFGMTLLIVLTIAPLARAAKINEGYVSALFMVTAAAAAFIIIYKLSLPAKEVFSLLWGNVFSLGTIDLALTLVWSGLILGFVLFAFRRISAVLFDREIAFSAGVNEKLLSNLIALCAGFTVTLALKLLGALLLDSILLLPALAAFLVARSAKGLFLLSLCLGLLYAVGGFFSAVILDLPASSGVTAAGAAGFIICFVISKITASRRGRRVT